MPGTSGQYEVSDRGRVCSLKISKWNRSGTRILKPQPADDYGHLRVSLYVDGRRFSKRVHYLVLLAFVGPPPPGHETRHINGTAHDNRLSNLAWGTHQENADDARRHGRTARGAANGASKLTWLLVREIRGRAQDEPQSELAKEYGVSKSTMNNIVRGVTWPDPSYSPPKSGWGMRRDPAFRRAVESMRSAGIPVSEIAASLSVSDQTVYRVLRALRG